MARKTPFKGRMLEIGQYATFEEESSPTLLLGRVKEIFAHSVGEMDYCWILFQTPRQYSVEPESGLVVFPAHMNGGDRLVRLQHVQEKIGVYADVTTPGRLVWNTFHKMAASKA